MFLFTQCVRRVTACNMTDGGEPPRGPREGGSRGLVRFKSDSDLPEPVCWCIIEKFGVHNQSHEKKTLTNRHAGCYLGP